MSCCGVRQRGPAAWALRTVAILNFLFGLAFLIYGLVIQTPPKTSIPLGTVILGTLSCVVALFGIIGSWRWLCCLTAYLVCGCLVTLGQMGIVIAMFVNEDAIVNQQATWNMNNDPTWLPTPDNIQSIANQINVGRWFFLVGVILQAIGLMVAVFLRLRKPAESEYDEFDAEQAKEMQRTADQQVQMQELRDGLGRPSGAPQTMGRANLYASNSLNKSVSKRMTGKYGDYSHDSSFQKGWFSKMFK
ncbi:hypothetical protein H632_c362p1 [Helicosporidium sp. ATCC 50920]|nr:hypothetical protein H632_c362p1 [Helicosporidium sp. ATCC 50920]|eukprot:KDD76086.1 hypothetical protein H632_c362p1 [Helicosporidium sp. ATCC 50920]